MTNIWDQTIFIDEILVKKLLVSQLNIQVESLELIGEGFDNLAYLVNNEFVFRFPRRAFGVTCMESEIAMLPYIAKHLTFEITAPQFIGAPSEAYPYPFAGYHLINGQALCDARKPRIDDLVFARIIGGWLKQLHSIPVLAVHESIGGSEHNLWRLDIPNRIKTSSSFLHEYRHCYEECGFVVDQLFEIIYSFSNLRFAPYQASYVHGDLYSRHIIVDENKMPIGLIDWGDTHIGHPGIDLSISMLFTESAYSEFVNAYGGIDSETRKVAIFRALCHSLTCLPYAYEQKNYGFIEWTVSTLEQSIKKFQEIGVKA
jgi:aminoglycoside phosphotransferase (APT) family kinase protein